MDLSTDSNDAVRAAAKAAFDGLPQDYETAGVGMKGRLIDEDRDSPSPTRTDTVPQARVGCAAIRHKKQHAPGNCGEEASEYRLVDRTRPGRSSRPRADPNTHVAIDCYFALDLEGEERQNFRVRDIVPVKKRMSSIISGSAAEIPNPPTRCSSSSRRRYNLAHASGVSRRVGFAVAERRGAGRSNLFIVLHRCSLLGVTKTRCGTEAIW